MKIKASELKKAPQKNKAPKKETPSKTKEAPVNEGNNTLDEADSKQEINLNKVVYMVDKPLFDEKGFFLHGSFYIHPAYLKVCISSLKHVINEFEGLWDKQTPQQKAYLLTLKGRYDQLIQAEEQLVKKSLKTVDNKKKGA